MTDFKHPANCCYQCHRPLPEDFQLLPWHLHLNPHGPMFHTQRCFDAAFNRHLPNVKYIPAEPDHKDDGYYERWHKEDIRKANNQLEHDALQTAHTSLLDEFRLAVQFYEENKCREQQEYLRKQQEKEAEQLNKQWEKARAEAEERQQFEDMIKPRQIPPKIRYEHTHVLGPSGSGKTTLLQNTILQDFADSNRNINTDPPAYIIIDPKGAMVERFRRLLIFERGYKDRLIVVDPYDAPALSMFSPTGINAAQMASHFSYIFSSSSQKLTGKQYTPFSFCVRLLFRIPRANLFTLLDLLDDGIDKRPRNPIFADAVSKLNDAGQAAMRRFFETDYFSPTFASTRQEIKSRVWALLSDERAVAMFNAHSRKLDIAKCIRERKIVLVNTRMVEMKETHQTLGRYIIALTADAIQGRTERHPVFLVIDEFQEFADKEKTPEILRLMREYNGGAVLAHQNMFCAELDDDTRTAISTNTSIKYASSPEGKDLNPMANDLRCDPDFLRK